LPDFPFSVGDCLLLLLVPLVALQTDTLQ
jgi:hypothetical protein